MNGLVCNLKPKSSGYAAQSTEAVMKIAPFSALEGKVEIPNFNIGFVRKGMQVDISIDSFPAKNFGVLEALCARWAPTRCPPTLPSRKPSIAIQP